MKDALIRAAQAMGLVATPALADTDVVVAEAVVTGADLEAPVLAVATEADAALSELQGKFEDQSAELATVLEELSLAKAALDQVTTALETINAANAEAAATALTAKMAAREAAVVASMGTTGAAAFMAATKEMPDAQFETIMAAMSASASKEADKPEFKEVGVEAQADVDALQAEAAVSGTEAILRDKYQKAK